MQVRKVETTPALDNVNGATYHNGLVYLVTNGGDVRGLYSLNVTSGGANLLLNNFRGRRFNSPNDLIFDSRSNILFTDPDYGWVNSWPEVREPELPNAIYHFDPSTRALRALSNSVVQMPNGLCLSADESTLYVADSNSSAGSLTSVRNVYAFDYKSTGPMLSNPRLVYQAGSGSPDGLRTTASGLLMVTSAGGVDVINPNNGLLLGKINTPDDIIYNLEPVPAKGIWILTGHKHIYKVAINENAHPRGSGSLVSTGLSTYLSMLQTYIGALLSGRPGAAGPKRTDDL